METVKRGMEALGMSSVSDWHFFNLKKPIRRSYAYNLAPSPYTDHSQYPPFFIPGLRARPFWNIREPGLEDLQILEQRSAAIKEELMTAAASDFIAYTDEADHRHSDWNILPFQINEKVFSQNIAKFPLTHQLLNSLPRMENSFVMISRLAPGKHIMPHVGPYNGILRVHLPLILPSSSTSCYITVGGEKRHWKAGEIMIFDDSFEHEVVNSSDESRTVLFFNYWHPDLADSELPVVKKMFGCLQRTVYFRQWADRQTAVPGQDH